LTDKHTGGFFACIAAATPALLLNAVSSTSAYSAGRAGLCKSAPSVFAFTYAETVMLKAAQNHNTKVKTPAYCED
jgi:hypothetical protein